MHTVFPLLCFVVVIHWLIFPYPSGLLHWHCGNLTIAPVPAKQPWWIWINTSCELIMNDCITTTKQSTTKPCAYFLGYTVIHWWQMNNLFSYHDISFNTNLHVNPMKPEQNGRYFLDYYQISDIRCTKSISSYVSCLVLQLCLPNPLKPGNKWRMKMVLQLHLSDQQFYCLLGCDLY